MFIPLTDHYGMDYEAKNNLGLVIVAWTMFYLMINIVIIVIDMISPLIEKIIIKIKRLRYLREYKKMREKMINELN